MWNLVDLARWLFFDFHGHEFALGRFCLKVNMATYAGSL